MEERAGERRCVFKQPLSSILSPFVPHGERKKILVRNSAAAEHRLKRNPAHVWPAQAEFNRVPEERQILRRHGHGERDGQFHFATAFETALARRAQIRAAQKFLRGFLRAVELEIKLELAVAKRRAEF